MADVIWGTHNELRAAYKRLRHFVCDDAAPVTSTTPFGRNLALFYDHDDDLVSGYVLLAGAGRILSHRLDSERALGNEGLLMDIRAWWCRANSVEWYR